MIALAPPSRYVEPSLSYVNVALAGNVSVLIALTVLGPVEPVTVTSTNSRTSVVKLLNVPTATVLIALVPTVALGDDPFIVTV